MNIWAIVLILGSVALLVGPVAMLQPTHLERRQAKLRAKARELGLYVHLRTLPESPAGVKSTKPIPLYVQPVRSKREWSLVRTRYAHEVHLQEWWEFADGQRPEPSLEAALGKVLSALPSSVSGVNQTPEGLGFFWDEKGGSERLSELSDILHRMANLVSETAEDDL